MSRHWGWMLTVCVACWCEIACSVQPEGVPRKLLLIGIDGCRFDALQVADAPNLDGLLAEGCHDPDCQILGERYRKNDTISGPGWSSILTGVWADKHGVHDNTFKGKDYAHHPHFFAWLKGSRPDTHAVSVVTWAPIQQHIVSEADRNLVFAPVEKDYARADVLASEASRRALADEALTVLFHYIGQVDEAGHAKGFHPSVPEYLAAIEQADRHVGELLAAMRARPAYENEDWLVLVTSDHGGKWLGHGNGHDIPEIRNSFLVVSGKSAKRGRIDQETYLVDVVPTALTHLGVRPQPEWKLDGQAVGLR